MTNTLLLKNLMSLQQKMLLEESNLKENLVKKHILILNLQALIKELTGIKQNNHSLQMK